MGNVDYPRLAAIWAGHMSDTNANGEHVARCMCQALAEGAGNLIEPEDWQSRTLELAFEPDTGNSVFFGVASNVLIVMKDDLIGQLQSTEPTR